MSEVGSAVFTRKGALGMHVHLSHCVVESPELNTFSLN